MLRRVCYFASQFTVTCTVNATHILFGIAQSGRGVVVCKECADKAHGLMPDSTFIEEREKITPVRF